MIGVLPVEGRQMASPRVAIARQVSCFAPAEQGVRRHAMLRLQGMKAVEIFPGVGVAAQLDQRFAGEELRQRCVLVVWISF